MKKCYNFVESSSDVTMVKINRCHIKSCKDTEVYEFKNRLYCKNHLTKIIARKEIRIFRTKKSKKVDK